MSFGLDQAAWYRRRRSFEKMPGIAIAAVAALSLWGAGEYLESIGYPKWFAEAGAAVVPTLYAVTAIFAALAWELHKREPPPPHF